MLYFQGDLVSMRVCFVYFSVNVVTQVIKGAEILLLLSQKTPHY